MTDMTPEDVYARALAILEGEAIDQDLSVEDAADAVCRALTIYRNSSGNLDMLALCSAHNVWIRAKAKAARRPPNEEPT